MPITNYDVWRSEQQKQDRQRDNVKGSTLLYDGNSQSRSENKGRGTYDPGDKKPQDPKTTVQPPKKPPKQPPRRPPRPPPKGDDHCDNSNMSRQEDSTYYGHRRTAYQPKEHRDCSEPKNLYQYEERRREGNNRSHYGTSSAGTRY
jgi:hypothetical protein